MIYTSLKEDFNNINHTGIGRAAQTELDEILTFPVNGQSWK